MARNYKQRVKIQLCDANDDLQVFEWVNGIIYLKAREKRLCMSIDYQHYLGNDEAPLVIATCMPNVFGVGEDDATTRWFLSEK